MLRSVFMVTASVIITAFISTCCVIFSLLGASENSIHKVARIWATMLLKITNVQVSVLGTEYISTERPQIFMSNHQSDFDIFIVLAYLPVQFRWLAKK